MAGTIETLPIQVLHERAAQLHGCPVWQVDCWRDTPAKCEVVFVLYFFCKVPKLVLSQKYRINTLYVLTVCERVAQAYAKDTEVQRRINDMLNVMEPEYGSA